MSVYKWLERIQALHAVDMDLSLERVQEVAKRLNVLNLDSLVITVGGTNGKGSCVAGLEAIYLEQGYRVGAFTSPYLIHYNEYVRIQGESVTDEAFCAAFERIEQVRGELTLTPFEFTALAAFDLFSRSQLDVWLLEVGLGGRFDAVNIIDSDLAMIATVALDHTEWLGDTREKIGFEKAGIFRPNCPALCGDTDPPQTLLEYAKGIKADLFCQNKDYSFERNTSTWTWRYQDVVLDQLPLPPLALQNMANVLMAVHLLQEKRPVSPTSIYKGLEKVKLMGRIQVIPGKIKQVWDVSHNPASAALLAQWLGDNPVSGITRAVFSMLGDKDLVGTLQIMKSWIDEWSIADLNVKRAASLEQLQKGFLDSQIEHVTSYQTIQMAYESAMSQSQEADRLVVFGSFHTVAGVSVK